MNHKRNMNPRGCPSLMGDEDTDTNQHLLASNFTEGLEFFLKIYSLVETGLNEAEVRLASDSQDIFIVLQVVMNLYSYHTRVTNFIILRKLLVQFICQRKVPLLGRILQRQILFVLEGSLFFSYLCAAFSHGSRTPSCQAVSVVGDGLTARAAEARRCAHAQGYRQ